MKKYIFLILLLTLTCFAGCTDVPQASPAPAPLAPYIAVTIGEAYVTLEIGEEEEVYAPLFSLPYGSTSIQLGANIDDVINEIGEPMAVFETPSCAFDGTDIVFRFPGVQIHTIPIGNEHFIHTMFLVDDTLGTEKGIFIGSGFDELIRFYGHDYTKEHGMYTFTRGHTSISFLINDGIVTAITYELNIPILIGD